jgi:hypothetical protein
MSISRRKFIKDSFGTIAFIAAGSALQSFLPKDFLLPARKDILLRFATASDGHYGQKGTNYEEDHKMMVRWLNKERKKRGLDFSVINGDLFHDNPMHLPGVKKTWDKLKMPYYVTHGNHDMIDEDTWRKTWGIPFDHAFEKDGIGFLILNTADIKGKYTGPDVTLTKQLLDRYDSKTKLFVFMHIAPAKWATYGVDRPDIVELFSRQKNLVAIFHGHDHDRDDAHEKDGKYYFWDAHIGGNWGTTYKGYRIVEILKNGTTIIYQMNPGAGSRVNSNSIA